MRTVWIDIDNPPQVKYLSPFINVFKEKEFSVYTTARDYGITYKLMDDDRIEYVKVGGYFGKNKIKKMTGTFKRSLQLWKLLKSVNPFLLLSSSRSSAIAAYLLGIPSFIVCDYEHSDLKLYKMFNSNIVFPDNIPVNTFINKGFKNNQLISFSGLKEQFSFYGKDCNKSSTIDFQAEKEVCKVLLRPPSVDTHYYQGESSILYKSLLEYLSLQENIKIIFYPRVKSQIQELLSYKFKYEPFVIRDGIDFLSLYKSIDLVISSGGTMLREAAFLNIPAYSIFMSKWGEVDNDLVKKGKLVCIKSNVDFKSIDFATRNIILDLSNKDKSIYDLTERIFKAANYVN